MELHTELETLNVNIAEVKVKIATYLYQYEHESDCRKTLLLEAMVQAEKQLSQLQRQKTIIMECPPSPVNSRPTTPFISLQQEFSGRVTPEEEKEEKKNLFKQYSGYIWKLEAFGFVGCVTVVNKTQAVTACHVIFPEEVFPMNMSFPSNHPTKFTIFNQKLNVTATVMVVDFDRVLDYAWLTLDPEANLCEFPECPLMIEFPDRMQEYYCLGYKNHLGNPVDSLSIVKGTIMSQPLTFYKGYVLGSPGTFPGFSGCGIFTRSVLLGICISGSESIGDCGCLQNQAFKKMYTDLVRQPSHTHILPMLSIDNYMKIKNIDVGPTIEQYYLTQLSAKKNENIM